MNNYINVLWNIYIHVTLFSRGQHPAYIKGTLISQSVISCFIILTLEIIGEDFIFTSLSCRKFTRK